MKQERLNYLAYNNAQTRKIVCREITTSGTRFTLECGHESSMPAHFDGNLCKDRQCMECGEIYVRNAPQYAIEFTEEYILKYGG